MWNLVEYDGLIAPQSYVSASQEERDRSCNGCGTSGWKGALVPETIWGVYVTPACLIHDWCYKEGRTEQDKELADMVFLRNMIRIIDQHGGWFDWLRRYRATTYYNAVVEFGHDAFWAGKNHA